MNYIGRGGKRNELEEEKKRGYIMKKEVVCSRRLINRNKIILFYIRSYERIKIKVN